MKKQRAWSEEQRARRGVAEAKSGARNSKPETNPNHQNSKAANSQTEFRDLLAALLKRQEIRWRKDLNMTIGRKLQEMLVA